MELSWADSADGSEVVRRSRGPVMEEMCRFIPRMSCVYLDWGEELKSLELLSMRRVWDGEFIDSYYISGDFSKAFDSLFSI
jgi:hypothetical protein